MATTKPTKCHCQCLLELFSWISIQSWDIPAQHLFLRLRNVRFSFSFFILLSLPSPFSSTFPCFFHKLIEITKTTFSDGLRKISILEEQSFLLLPWFTLHNVIVMSQALDSMGILVHWVDFQSFQFFISFLFDFWFCE